MNFDILKALIEEMNRYNEPATEALKILNAKPGFSSNDNNYFYDLFIDGIKIEQKDLDNHYWRGNPLSGTTAIGYKQYTDDKKDYGWVYAKFNPADLVLADPRNGKYIFEQNNMRLILKEERIPLFMFY